MELHHLAQPTTALKRLFLGRALVPAFGHRWPTVAPVNRSLYSRGWERQYCFGALTCAPSFAAACQGQRGSYNMARASETASASSFAMMASACSGSVISPTAMVGRPTSALTRRA